MLGNVSPRTLRITPHPAVYTGRDNVTLLVFDVLDGRRYVPLNITGVTRWQLALPDIGALFDSATVPGVFIVQGNTLQVDLSQYVIPDSRQACLLVAFDAAHPNGQVLVDNDDCAVVFKFSSVATSGALPIPLTPSSDVSLFVAGTVLSGHRAVYSDGVTARYASSSDLSSAERCIGITTQAAAQGALVYVRRAGLLVEPTWSWAAGPVWLALDGALTQTIPTTGVMLQVGMALDPTTLDVRVGTPVTLE